MKTVANVQDEMTYHAVTVSPDDDLYHAFAVMRRGGFRHLPVIERGELVGMLSDRDVFRDGNLLDGVLVVGKKLVKDAMTKGVQTCRPGDALGDAADILVRSGIDALPVVDARGAVIGILTSTDLLRSLRR